MTEDLEAKLIETFSLRSSTNTMNSASVVLILKLFVLIAIWRLAICNFNISTNKVKLPVMVAVFGMARFIIVA